VSIALTGELLPEGEAALSHDVRNSMAALRVIVEGLRDGVVKATPESGIPDQMMLHIRLLSDLLDDHSHLGEARQGAAGVGPVRIGCFLEQWSEAMRPKARQRRVDLRLVVAPSLPDIECRAGQVARVLLNLIDNAIRYTPAGGTVSLRAVAHPGGAQVQVNDTGPGLPQAVRTALLEAPGSAISPPAGRGASAS
jgi:signal transduction histidine kinase